MKEMNTIYLRRRNKVIVNLNDDNSEKVNEQIIATSLVNLESYGYTFSEKLMEELTPLLSEVGVKIYDISFEKEDGVDTLFIKIDSDKEVDTDLCTMVSNIVNPVIDKLDLIKEEYVLDICSKGEENE